jgi:D-alanine-D-alanine ligase
MSRKGLRKLRVLVLTDEALVPIAPRAELEGRDAELRKTEYDVLEALESIGHQVNCIGVGSELGVLRRAINEFTPDIAFNLVEEFDGYPLFDQHVVSYLELIKQKYTGCSPRGLTIARDKALTKMILTYHRIHVPRFAVFELNKKVLPPRRLSYPLFVKSVTEEGSEGISQASLVRDRDKLIERIAFIHEKTQSAALVEEFIEGREIYVGVLGNKRLDSLPPWELRMTKLADGAPVIATDKAKWDPDYQKEIGLKSGPARLTGDEAKVLARVSKRIYRLLYLSGYARLDYRLRDGRVYLLEANPNPQIARNEDFADSAAHAGIPYEQLLQKILTLGASYEPRQCV